MLAVEGDDVRGPGSYCHFQYHVILRIWKDATPEVMDGLLPGNLCDSIDHVINRPCGDGDAAFFPVADIIVFRE